MKGYLLKQQLPLIRSHGWYEQGNSNYGGLVFPHRAPDRAGQVSVELQSIPLAHTLRYAPPAVFPPHSTSLLHSHSLHHLYSQTLRALTRCSIVLAVLVSYVARHGGSDHSSARTNWMGQLLGPHYV